MIPTSRAKPGRLRTRAARRARPSAIPGTSSDTCRQTSQPPTIDTDGDPTASIERALQTAQMYRLSNTRAIEIVDEVEQATAAWRTVATRLELPARELDLMRAAFDTPERMTARAIVTQHRSSIK